MSESTEREERDDITVPRRAQTVRGDTATTDDVALLPEERLASFRSEWDHLQTGFVDRPHEAVEEAEELVDRLVDELVESFSRQRETLSGGLGRGDDTEALRLALQRYRSFFNRLLRT
jgi:hypothetical protein